MADITAVTDKRINSEFSNTEIEAGIDPLTGNWEVIVKYNGNIMQLEQVLGAEVEILNQNYAIIMLDQDKIQRLYEFPDIEYIELPKFLTSNLSEGTDRACITPVQRADGMMLSGKGTIVAIIDSGIDYMHPDFRNPDGSSRILYIWDQAAQGNPPQGFKSGAEYNNVQINEAILSGQSGRIVPEGDVIGHGTAVAGVAAGNGRASAGREQGAAPEAFLISVKLGERGRQSFARTTEMMRALRYVVSKAQELNMPLSVNISYGTNNGSHAGRSLFESYLNDISMEWKTTVTVASGNEGAAGHHFWYQVKQDETIAAEFSSAANLQSFYLSIWKNYVDDLEFELIAPNGMSSDTIHRHSPKLVHFGDCSILVNYGTPVAYSEEHEIFLQVRAKEGFIRAGIWNLYIKGRQVVDGAVNIWLPTLEEVSAGTAFLRPNTEITLTLPSTALNALTVGAYNSKVNSSASFSGRGYTRNIVYAKPDLVAPGVDIISAKRGGGYGVFTGTSIAAPFAAGAAALMMQWGIIQRNDPFLYGQKVKALLQRGAGRSSQTVYPNPVWGYGTLCLQDSMYYALESI